MADLTATLLESALEQLSQRAAAGDKALLHHQTQTAQRFSEVQKAVADGFGRFEDKLSDAFGSMYARLDQVCDKGGTEHAEFRAGILALNERMAAWENQAKGRGQVWGALKEAGAWTVQNFWPLATISLLAFTAAERLPRLFDGGDADAAEAVIDAQLDPASHMGAGVRAVSALPPVEVYQEPQPLRGFAPES